MKVVSKYTNIDVQTKHTVMYHAPVTYRSQAELGSMCKEVFNEILNKNIETQSNVKVSKQAWV